MYRWGSADTVLGPDLIELEKRVDTIKKSFATASKRITNSYISNGSSGQLSPEEIDKRVVLFDN